MSRSCPSPFGRRKHEQRRLSNAVSAFFDAHRLLVAAQIHLDDAEVHGGDLWDFILPDLLDDIFDVAQHLQHEVDAFGHDEVRRRAA